MMEMTTELVTYIAEKKSNVKTINMHPGWAKTPGLETLYDT